ncbi:MAG TPA: MATE family efflux transporter, partial [Kofleriaceae bacterium]|nr:MATE family efflux transporter [Kofleriaceae bacterium]
MAREVPAGATGERAALLRLAVPLVAQQVGFQLMGNVDAALLGHYSDTGLAAAGTGNNLLFAIFSLGMGLVLGLDTVAPQALGAGRHADARRALSAGLRIALLAGLACTLLTLAAPLLLIPIGVPREVADDARAYLAMRAFGIVPAMVSVALRSYLAAHDVTRPLVIAVVLGNLANAALDVVLIFGAGPIPSLGVLGAGLATVTVQTATLGIYFAGVRAIDGRAPRPASTRADLAHILRYGVPIAGHMFAEIGIFGVATMIAAHLGTIPAAAHS